LIGWRIIKRSSQPATGAQKVLQTNGIEIVYVPVEIYSREEPDLCHPSITCPWGHR